MESINSNSKTTKEPIPCRSSIALAIAKGKKAAQQKKTEDSPVPKGTYRQKFPP